MEKKVVESKSGSRFIALECMKCHAEYPPETRTRCKKCGGLLTGKYDLDGDAPFELKKRGVSMWQFRSLFPPVSDENVVSLGEGWTPLVGASIYGRSIGSKKLTCKLEGLNPSGSFKDRIGSLGLSLAKQWQKKGVFTASSGNAAAAISAYSARAGIPCLVLIREDSTPSKLGQISMYGAHLLRVRDLFATKDSLFRALELTQRALPDWLNHFAWIPYNPLLIDGQKTIAYEIASLGDLPDYVFVPTAGGDLVFGLYKGFSELKTLGLTDRIPRMVVVQGMNSNPSVQALDSNLETVKDTADARTVAGALRVNFGEAHTLVAAKNSNGFGISPTDEEIVAAQREVAKLEGIFCEISSATALAAVKKSIEEGRISKDDNACAILTGSGFKDYHPLFDDISEVPLATKPELIPDTLQKSFPPG